jgi:hypothetical protein
VPLFLFSAPPPPHWPRCPRSSPSARPRPSCGSGATSSTRRSRAASWARSASAAASASPNTPCWTYSPPPDPRPPAAMTSRGNLQRKCVKAHPKAAGRCSGRCIRYYPRLELPRRRDGTRRFEALGGYPTRAQAEAALADALARRSHGLALDPAKLTVDQYLDRWLTHVRTSLRPAPWPATRPCCATTSAPHSAPDPSSNSPRWRSRPPMTGWPSTAAGTTTRAGSPPAHPGRAPLPAPRPGPGGHLAAAGPQRRHRRHPTTGAPTDVVALAPEQVAVLLDAADQSPSPWLGPQTVLAAATGPATAGSAAGMGGSGPGCRHGPVPSGPPHHRPGHPSR